MNIEGPYQNYETLEGGADLEWLEPFEWREPPEWNQASDLIELSGQILDDKRIEAGLWLLYNREKARQLHGWEEALHTAPSAEHYRHTYLWDSGFFGIIYSQGSLFASKAAEHLENNAQLVQSQEDQRLISSAVDELRSLSENFGRAALEESFWVVNGQRPNGFIANVQYADGWLWYEWEKLLSHDKTKRTSNYTQPPVLPLMAMSIYKSMAESGNPNAAVYLESIYPYLDKLLRFFYNERSNSDDDRLVGVIEPHETGMDSLEQWDYIKPHRLPRNGVDTDKELDMRNRFADAAHFMVRITQRKLLAGSDPEKERELFWANDVAMNGIYSHNLQVMAWLSEKSGRDEAAAFYKKAAGQVSEAMCQRMWITDEKKVSQKGFYSLNSEGEPIDTITISNLFALTLPGLSNEQLETMLDIMDEHFKVPYPLPSGSIRSPNFDPYNQEEDRLWRGPTWLNTNWYIVEFGLRMQNGRQRIRPDLRQRCAAWAERVAQKSNELLDKNHPEGLSANNTLDELVMAGVIGDDAVKKKKITTGSWEHFNSLTGRGQRARVLNFGWNWIVRFMEYKKGPEYSGPLANTKEQS